MFDLHKVFKVYSGKAGSCMCGCSGKYKISSALREEANRDRGYDHNDQDVSDVTVRRTVGKILSAAKPVFESNYVYTVIGNRIHVAYFTK